MRTSRDPERLIIRPPSEAWSVLVRVTRGCGWGRCRFCGLYPALGEPEFSARPLADVLADVDALAERFAGARKVFLGDADPLSIPLEESEAVIQRIRAALPALERLTAYARASTLWKLRPRGLQRLAAAGLTRVHVGLESGDPETLRFHRKGQNPKVLIESGQWLKAAGIEVSYYVLLGLGGVERWQAHMDGTAEVINAVDPEFIRVRRIWLYQEEREGKLEECPLWDAIRDGSFVQQTAEGTVLELKRLLERLDGVSSLFTCDHANNYVQVQGQLMEERDAMLAEVDGFLILPAEQRQAHYACVGNRI